MRVAVMAVLMLGGCTLMPGGGDERARSTFVLTPEPGPALDGLACGSIQVSPGTGASGFRTARMAYSRTPYQIEYFAWSVWADSPSRMLGEAVRADLYASGAFDAVISTPAATATNLRLDLADLRLVQNFSGETSEVELSLEARLSASAHPDELASQRFSVRRSAEPDPRGGVTAANAAAGEVLSQLRRFVTERCSR